MQAGMFVYADGRVTYDLYSGERSGNNEIVAIFVSANPRTRRALCLTLEEVLLPWSSDEISVEQDDVFASGAKFTQQILKAAGKKFLAEAAYFCTSYRNSVIQAGTAFLPAVRDVVALEGAIEKRINISLSRLKLPELFEDGPLWTAEVEGNDANMVMHGHVISEPKCFSHNVRPFVLFDF